VVDTSIWIHVHRHHPPDIFLSLWQKLDGAVAAADLMSSDEVLHELERGEDALAEILGSRQGLFVPLDDAKMRAVAEVIQACQGLVNEEAERGRADPFVVALARVRHGTVVTAERPRRAAAAPFKIPDACAHYGIPYLDWFGFLREVEWQL
jgi:predicted nucleic acid-binding protein